MSTQPTPSPHQHETATFTTGKFKSDANFILDGSVDIGRFDLAALSREEAYGNASLTATCFNSATALWQAGYDAQRVIEALPEIMASLDTCEDGWKWRVQLKEQLRRPKGTQ